MTPLARWLVGAVGALHLLFLAAEVLLWKPLLPFLRIYDKDRAEATAAVGANMGVYNGILGATLIWLAWDAPGLGPRPARAFATCLLVGVIVAGVAGGLTIQWTIPLFQSLPALVALAVVRGWT